MKKIVINGKFMSQTVTGVQRYAREILNELDKILTADHDVILAVDRNAQKIPDYKNIKVKQIGRFYGNLWEQISLPFYAIKNKAFCLSLCNMAPILKPDGVVIHDISYAVNRKFFSKKFSVWYRFVFFMCIKRVHKIITVSEFSKNEIKRYYGIDNEIYVISNGWQHFERIKYDENTLNKYDLSKDKFYFAMSSMAPNKNFKWIAKAAKNNPEMLFAVSGAINTKVFGDIFDFEIPDNLKFLGYVSDEEAKTLMRDCKAFLFPTFYEGFGIPPLEALSVGAKVIASDASCMREIFEDSVCYIDPYNSDVDLNKLINTPIESSEKILNKFSWKKSAERILNVLKG